MVILYDATIILKYFCSSLSSLLCEFLIHWLVLKLWLKNNYIWQSCAGIREEFWAAFLPWKIYLWYSPRYWEKRESSLSARKLGNFTSFFPTLLIQAQTKAQAWKWFIISGDGVRPSVHTYVQNKTNRSKIKPLFKLVLWLVLGRGSLYDSSLVMYLYSLIRWNLINYNK